MYGAWWREHHESRGGIADQQKRLRKLIARMWGGAIADSRRRGPISGMMHAMSFDRYAA
jgi:hypothetical protein